MAICHHQPPFAATSSSFSISDSFKPPKLSPSSSYRFNISVASRLELDPYPVFTSVKSFAPATVANLGPGFDFLGCAIDGIGDYVTLTVDPDVQPGRLSISEITGVDNSSKRLSKNPLWNCAGIAAISVMKMLRIRSVGLSLTINTCLPLRSGLGSSAASAAAAAVAVNAIFGGKLQDSDLVLAGLEAEAKLSGHHADNIAPAIMGGFVLIRSYDPLELISLKFPTEKNLFFVLVNPEFQAQTKKMRAVLPTEITMSDHVWNCTQAAALVAGVLQGDLVGFGKAFSSDRIVEPRRAPLGHPVWASGSRLEAAWSRVEPHPRPRGAAWKTPRLEAIEAFHGLPLGKVDPTRVEPRGTTSHPVWSRVKPRGGDVSLFSLILFLCGHGVHHTTPGGLSSGNGRSEEGSNGGRGIWVYDKWVRADGGGGDG